MTRSTALPVGVIPASTDEFVMNQGSKTVRTPAALVPSLAGSVATLSSISALRSSSPASPSLTVQGFSAAGDGGGGIYVYDPVDVSSPDDGGLVVVDRSGRRWKRSYDNSAKSAWFGANINGLSDPSTALNAMFSSSASNLLMQDGAYNFATNIVPSIRDGLFQSGGAVSFTGAGRLSFTSWVPFQGGPIWSQALSRKTYDSSWTNWGNIFHQASYITSQIPSASLGGGNIVSLFAGADAAGANSSVWATNFVAYANSSTATSIGMEMNFGSLVSGGTAHGIVLAAAGNFPAREAIQIQANNAASVISHGIRFHNRSTGLIDTAGGALLKLDGGAGNPTSAAAYGIDFSDGSFPLAELKFPSFVVGPTITSTTNRLLIHGAADGGQPIITIQADNDTDCTLIIKPFGPGGDVTVTAGTGQNIFRMNGGSGADAGQVSNGTGEVTYSIVGGSTDVWTGIRGKGARGVRLYDGGGTIRMVSSTAGVGFNGNNPVIPNLTGALSSVTDAAAKAVLTSIVTGLTSLGLTTNGTT